MLEYFENPLMPGKPMFRCASLSASIKVETCAEMWRQANGQQAPERLWKCKGCRIGAGHAGADDVAMNPIRGTLTCVRCCRGDMRLIRGLVCVSCANRAYEWHKGKNAKGAFPKHHPKILKIRLNYSVGGRAYHSVRDAASALELVVELLRDSEKRVVFGMGRGRGAA